MKYLGDIARIRAGYPFRSKIVDHPTGNARVVQMRDVDREQGVDWESLATVQLPGRKQADWLEPGDILFVARGNHNFALHLDEVPYPAVSSPHFFHLSVEPRTGILPGFLAWQINQAPAQQYLGKSAEGGTVQSVRRQVLEEIPIAVPSLEQQEAIIRLDRVCRQERQVLERLMDNRRRMMAGLAQQLLDNE